jgi:hypothetical protein
MKRIKVLGLAIVAAFAMSAVGASAAVSAIVEGPFWKVEGVRLANGAAKEIRVTGTSTRQELKTSIGVKIKCEKVMVEATPTPEIVGKPLGWGGTSIEKLRYTGNCVVEGDGSTCKVKGGEVKTENLANREGYEGERTGNLLTGLKPEGTNKVFAKLKFEGTCTFGSENNVELATGKVLGVVCFDLREAGAKVTVTAAQGEDLKPQIECPATKIAQMFYEEKSGLKREEAGLTGEYIGNVGIEVLEAGVAQKWGVFT